MEPFQQTIYQMALAATGQLTSDELHTTLKETLPLMKALIDAEEQAQQPATSTPQY